MLSHDYGFVFGQNLLNKHRFMSWCIIMVQNPCLAFPQSCVFLTNYFKQSVLNFKVVFLINRTTLWQEFIMHLAIAIEENAFDRTYLINHKHPINEFQPAATHPSRRLCFLRTYASRLLQTMTGLPRFAPSNAYKVFLFANFLRPPHQIHVSPKYSSPFERQGRANAAAGY